MKTRLNGIILYLNCYRVHVKATEFGLTSWWTTFLVVQLGYISKKETVWNKYIEHTVICVQYYLIWTSFPSSESDGVLLGDVGGLSRSQSSSAPGITSSSVSSVESERLVFRADKVASSSSYVPCEEWSFLDFLSKNKFSGSIHSYKIKRNVQYTPICDNGASLSIYRGFFLPLFLSASFLALFL